MMGKEDFSDIQKTRDEKAQLFFESAQTKPGFMMIPACSAVLINESTTEAQVSTHVGRDTSVPVTNFTYTPNSQVNAVDLGKIYTCGVVKISVGKLKLVAHGYFPDSLRTLLDQFKDEISAEYKKTKECRIELKYTTEYRKRNEYKKVLAKFSADYLGATDFETETISSSVDFIDTI